MNWETRLTQAAYTSPAGQRVAFQYENVSRSVAKKTTNFEFPDADGSYIQDLGREGRRFPFRAFFSGANHDTDAESFESALLERGQGTLDHPFYGQFPVVPFGNIRRRDDLKTAANQSIVEVTFWETIGLIYPSISSDPVADVNDAQQTFDTSAAGEFADQVDVSTEGLVQGALTTFNDALDTVEDALQPIADLQDSVADTFQDINDSINRAIDVLIRDPLALASQTIQLIKAPARAVGAISDRLEAYGNLAGQLIRYEPSVAPNTADQNDFVITDLNATAAVSGSVEAVINTTYTSQPEAIEAADVLISQLDDVVAWRERIYNRFPDLVDTGASYQALQEAVALSVGYLVELAFSLRQERVIQIDRDRTIIDLSAELYGRVDDRTLNLLIDSNRLTGSEILELPRGRSIRYYV